MLSTDRHTATSTRRTELRLIGIADLQDKLSVSRSTVYRLTAAKDRGAEKDDFPPPVKIGRAVRWPEHLVDEWLERQMTSTAPQHPRV